MQLLTLGREPIFWVTHVLNSLLEPLFCLDSGTPGTFHWCILRAAELWDISGNHTAPSSEISLEITVQLPEGILWLWRSGNPREELFEAGTWVGMGLLGNSTVNFLSPKQNAFSSAAYWPRFRIWVESVLCSSQLFLRAVCIFLLN